jgi:hypothetical protein
MATTISWRSMCISICASALIGLGSGIVLSSRSFELEAHIPVVGSFLIRNSISPNYSGNCIADSAVRNCVN